MNNILIIQQPVGNRGDESAHRGLMCQLVKNYPECKITVLFFARFQKDVDEFVVNHPNIQYKIVKADRPARFSLPIIVNYAKGKVPFSIVKVLPSIREIISYYKEADCVVGAPGGINLGGFRDWIHLAMFMLAKDCGCKLGYFARSIGPFSDDTAENSLFKEKCKKLFGYFSVISLRDDKSINVAKSLDFEAIETIDSAFLADRISVEAPEQFSDAIGGDKYIIFVPNSLVWHYKYKSLSLEEVTEMWTKLLNRLLEVYPSHKIAMLPQTTGYSEAVPDGYIFFNKIKDGSTTPDRVVVLGEQYGSDIQQSIISKADVLIGARYHSVVFAINQSTPFVSLSYEHKMSGLLSMIGLEKNQINIEKLLLEEKVESDTLIEAAVSMALETKPIGENRAKIIALKGFNDFFSRLFSK